LFQKNLADPLEVQLSVRFLGTRGEFGGNIGYSAGLIQFYLQRVPIQLRIEGNSFLVSKLETPDFPMQTADFTVAFPLELQVSRFALRLKWSHTSSHLGDDFNRIDNVDAAIEPGSAETLVFLRARKFSREHVTLLGAYQASHFRFYGGGVWTYHIAADLSENTPGQAITPEAGVELFPNPAGLIKPYFAGHFRTEEEFDWHVSYNLQAGIIVGQQNLRRMRLAVEFFEGQSNQGQFLSRKEQDLNLVLAFDF